MLASHCRSAAHLCCFPGPGHPELWYRFVLKESNTVIFQKGNEGKTRCRRVKKRAEKMGKHETYLLLKI